MANEKIWFIRKENGVPELVWDCAKYPDDHMDFIEMSGLFASVTLKYGIENGIGRFSRILVFPRLRRKPNITAGSYRVEIDNEKIPYLRVNGEKYEEKPSQFILRGRVESRSEYHENAADMKAVHVFFPCTDKTAICELLTLENIGKDDIRLEVDGERKQAYETYLGPKGVVSSWIDAKLLSGSRDFAGKGFVLKPGKEARFCLIFSARQGLEEDVSETFRPEAEYFKRLKRVSELVAPLKMESGNEIFDTMFEFAKIRAGENIFRTAAGDIHCPGGKAYYGAVWANDQVEYAGPWQAYTGDPLQVNAGYTAYSWYFPYMSTYDIPFPSSIIAEAVDYWNGAGDRGDAAMYLYGASRYALTCGKLGPGKVLWKAILWCAGFCQSRINEKGVITSDSDELEHRLPSGEANLCTNMLALGGFRYASRIARALGDHRCADEFRRTANTLEKKCEEYFGADIHGFHTYRYYEGNTTLRSWICMPLCVGIDKRSDGTSAAITSEYLMSDAGQLSEEGTTVAWDRSTLYGLRGMFRVGKCNEAWDYLKFYCERRLLCQHVPYAVEAYPEGSQRQLSAESALFCQIVTEGMLAIEALSFSSFEFMPQLPDGLDRLKVSGIHAFGQVFDIEVCRSGWTVRTEDGASLTGDYGKLAEVEFKVRV